jgi:hypothetical protein
MATDSTGGTTIDKCQLDSSGYPTTDGSTRFIPYVNQKYKIALYQNATDADANTTANADWVIDTIGQTLTADGSIQQFNTLTLAKAASVLSDGERLRTDGYASVNDGGDGYYYYDAGSSDTADNFTVIALDTLGGRLKLIHDGVVDSRVGGVVYDDSTENRAAFMNITGASNIYEIICTGGTAQVEATTDYTESVMGEDIGAGIRMYANQTLTIMSDAVIKQVAWAGAGGANDNGGNIVAVMSIDNVLIRGKGTLRGNFPPGSTHSGRATDSNHCINIGNCTNVTVKDVRCEDAWTDGIVVTYFANKAAANNCVNINLINCHAHENRRNGASIVGCVGGSIIGGSYKTNVGTSPESGIDLEANTGISNIGDGQAFVKDYVVCGVVTGGNRRSGLSVSAPSSTDRSENVNITIIGCQFPDRVVAERLSNCSFIGNTCASTVDDPDSPFTPFAAMDIIDCVDCLILGNMISEARAYGIHLRSAFSVGGTEATITGATQANPVVITATSHGHSDGDIVYVDNVTGMTEINDLRFKVANGTSNTYELNYLDDTNVNGTGYTAYSSGGRSSDSRLCDNNIVVGNVIRKVGRATTATYSGIRVEGSKNIIALNSCRRFGSGNEPIYGFWMNAASAYNYMLLNDGSGFRDAGGKIWLDQGDNGNDNTVIGLGEIGDQKIYINTSEDVTPSASNQGIMIDRDAITMSYTGSGAKLMLNLFDGVGDCGGIGVDGSQHLKVTMTGLSNSPVIVCNDGGPESVVTADPGSICLNLNATSAEYAIYIKRTGAGNTGWEGVGTIIP